MNGEFNKVENNILRVGDAIGANLGNNIISNNLIISSSGDGIFVYSDNNTIIENVISNSPTIGRGIILQGHNNKAINNTMLDLGLEGVVIFEGSYNFVSNNFINNTGLGVFIQFGNNNNIEGNDINGNGNGFYMESSHNNIISNNIIHDGIYPGISMLNSRYNVIKNNIITRHGRGITLQSSSNYNLIWNNTFIDNNLSNGYEYSANNYWNNSEIGNYWDDFENNSGYPNYYEVYGPASGIDYKPIYDGDGDGYYI